MTAQDNRPLRILQVGCGARGRMWAQIIDRRSDCGHSAFVDRNPAAVAEFRSTRPDVPGFTDLSTALAKCDSDAVLLVTPPDAHLAQVRQVFDAGLPLLSEKPLALALPEAIEIVDIARSAMQPLIVCLNFRYLPVSQKIRQLISERALGEPGFGLFSYLRDRDGRAPHLNKYPLSMEHPMMLEQTIHHLDLIRYCYAQEVEAVTCRTWNPSWSMYAHHSNVNCLLRLRNGLEVNYIGTWTGGWQELQFQWRTDCADGVIVQQQLFEDLAVAKRDSAELTAVPLPPFEAFIDDTSALLGDFVQLVRSGKSMHCTGGDHLYSLALCFAAIESSQSGRTVYMDDYHERIGIELPA